MAAKAACWRAAARPSARDPANPLEDALGGGHLAPFASRIGGLPKSACPIGRWPRPVAGPSPSCTRVIATDTSSIRAPAEPAEGVLSTTVVAPTAALADALSTAFYVMGPDRMLDYCRDRPEIGVVMACPVRHSGGIEIQSIGLTEDELRFL